MADPIDVALGRVRARYISGEIEADEFEHAVGVFHALGELPPQDAKTVEASDFADLAEPEFAAALDLINARLAD